MFRLYADFTKLGIVIFSTLAGLAGYALSYTVESTFSSLHLIAFTLGITLLGCGSLALNQVQDIEMDKKMPRTQRRPLASGQMSLKTGVLIVASHLLLGTLLLWWVAPLSAVLGILTVVLYNGFYAYWWKKKWVFGAIPGAIPGALPVSMGYAANSTQILSSESVYLFLILFLWQMPHFWALALRYRDDYAQAGVPTLSVTLGVEKTLFHIGIWTFAYVIVAVASPWFVHASWLYLLLIFPFVFKLLQEFYRLFVSNGEKRWLAFFTWVNLSLLVFLFVPVIDKWSFLLLPKV